MAGEETSGDLWAVVAMEDAVLLAVVDGVGHGPPARVAARRAVEVLGERPDQPADALLSRCHRSLVETRGAAVTVATLGFSTPAVSWLGVGNVAGVVVQATAWGTRTMASAPLHGGIVGYQLPPLRAPGALGVRPGDLVALASDGITGGFGEGLRLDRAAYDLAEDILARSGTDTDDALVLVARHRGAPR
ncbi:MAG TPA: SpoIIE family protein phosphatase [Acidimicrobiales bacterium]|jgi:negative regulator of sigma-B (phosphoserine phosphatase)|nr:SpoIIE family protein phosphatase [Acidimicrobiales bacterium]